jgi:alkylhydroperoxidase family enzyme
MTTTKAQLEPPSRVAPLEPPYSAEIAGALRDMMPPGVPPIALFRTLVTHPALTDAMRPLGSYALGRELTISLRQREIVIDRTCARCGCEYEWGVHIAFFAARAHLDRAQVISLTHGQPTDPCWVDPADRLLIEAVDQLHDTADINDELWAALSRAYDARQLLDLLMLAGWYHAISFIARSARVAGESGAPRFGDYPRRRELHQAERWISDLGRIPTSSAAMPAAEQSKGEEPK